MLSEEALILIAVVGACALLILGIIELVWPSKPRHPVRRSQRPPATPARRGRRSKLSPHARPHAGTAGGESTRSAWAVGGLRKTPEGSDAPESVVAGPASTASSEGGPRTAPESADTPESAAAERASAASSEGGPSLAPEGSDMPASPPAAAPAFDPLLVETCFSLYQERCYAEVISLGEEALAKARAAALTADGAHDGAALWSVVALAKQALGDDDGARVALEAALGVCPDDERPTYRQHLAALALNAAQTRLARAGSDEADDRVATLRAALVWVAHGLDAVPADDRLRDARVAAHEALWPAYEQAVHKLLHRQEFEEARRVLREALDDPELPSSRAEEFRELLSGTFGGEIGQLTAQAIRSMQEERESEALAALQRAEELLAAVPDAALPPKRREEVDQRLWWGYTRLGIRRVESGEYEAALEPLVHALRFADINADRQGETRAALVRALEGVADVRALSVRQLADEGNRDEAVLRTEALRELLRSCLELGVPEDELSVAFARIRRLVEELGMEERA